MLRRSTIPIATALLLQAVLLALIVIGPPLWASQILPNRAYALLIYGVGALVLLAVFWPVLLRSFAGCVVMLVAMPIGSLIAASVQHIGTFAAMKLAATLDGSLLLIATIWAIAPRIRGGRGIAWSAMLAAALGLATLDFLAMDFTSESGWSSHFSPLRLLATTFSH